MKNAFGLPQHCTDDFIFTVRSVKTVMEEYKRIRELYSNLVTTENEKDLMMLLNIVSSNSYLEAMYAARYDGQE